jgi:hypothetical protein
MVRLRIAAPVGLIAAGALILSSCSPGASGSARTLPSSTSPTPSSSATPSSEPTPIVSSWTGLEWSGPVAPFPSESSWITDIVRWRDGYVGVGGTNAPLGSGLGTIFASTDGLHWTITFQADLPQGWYFEHLVPLGEGLLAVSNVRGISCPANTSPCPPQDADLSNRLWHSNDGATWTQIDSPSWRAAWPTGVASLKVVGGPEGVVAVASSGHVVVHSTDGQKWERVDGLPAVTGAIIRDVAAFPGGFVIVGRDGEPDPFSQAGPQPPPGIGRPAAWSSDDGVTWIAAQVPGSDVAGGELRAVAAGANGLFAIGINRAIQDALDAPTSGWASADGRTWRLVGELAADLPDTELLVGDGVHMVILGSESPGSPMLAASVSSDGAEWTPLTFSGATTLPGIGRWNPPSGISLVWALVVSDGMIVRGTGAIPQQLWFATEIGA